MLGKKEVSVWCIFLRGLVRRVVVRFGDSDAGRNGGCFLSRRRRRLHLHRVRIRGCLVGLWMIFCLRLFLFLKELFWCLLSVFSSSVADVTFDLFVVHLRYNTRNLARKEWRMWKCSMRRRLWVEKENEGKKHGFFVFLWMKVMKGLVNLFNFCDSELWF